MWFGKSIMALVADCGFRRYLGTGKSLSFVGDVVTVGNAVEVIALGHDYKGFPKNQVPMVF